jgi:hypothetical protein
MPSNDPGQDDGMVVSHNQSITQAEFHTSDLNYPVKKVGRGDIYSNASSHFVWVWQSDSGS